MEKRTVLLLICFLAALAALVLVPSFQNPFVSYDANVNRECPEGGDCAGGRWTFCGCPKKYTEGRPWYGLFAP